ncbi:hypothetical protein H0H92_001584 [Tricholoma furcatifolium]|nr:hypothetical protein H0H92_001584 [Tricholoma furcatifolium]
MERYVSARRPVKKPQASKRACLTDDEADDEYEECITVPLVHSKFHMDSIRIPGIVHMESSWTFRELLPPFLIKNRCNKQDSNL